MELLVDAVPCLAALDAPVPLVVEQLVTVLAEMEREEDVEMNRVEDRILQGAPVYAAEKAGLETLGFEGRRVFVEEKKKEEEKEASSRVLTVQNCAEDRETPQKQGFGRRSCSDKFQQFVVLGAVQSVHLQSADYPLCAETCAHSANCAADR